MDDETRRQIEEQIRAELARKYAEIRERQADRASPLPFPDAAIEATFDQHIEDEVAGWMAFAEEVWEEGGRQLPLSEIQISNLNIRHSLTKTTTLTDQMAARLDTLPPDRREIAAQFVGMFQAQNEQLARFRHVDQVTQADIDQFSESTVAGLSQITERLREQRQAQLESLPPEKRAAAEEHLNIISRIADPSLKDEERQEILKRSQEMLESLRVDCDNESH